MAEQPVYDATGIARGYAEARRADPRIAAHIWAGLGDAKSVVQVGAGTGNYEPPDRRVVAVEPALAMIAQRPPGAASVVRAVAEALPFPDHTFEAALAVLTIHHWADIPAGLRELRRVARRQVLFVFDPAMTHRFWAMAYWPEALELPTERRWVDAESVGAVLDVREVRPVPVPIDCTDGFGAAYWGRPEAYLDPAVHAGMSWLALLPEDVRAAGAARLDADLRSGEWDRRLGHLRSEQERDMGYRLVVAGGR